MSKNIIILIFLVLMAVAAFFSVHSFSRVEEEKKKSQLANDKLSAQLVINNAQQKLIDSLSIVTILALNKKNSNTALVSTPAANDSAETLLIRKLKTANEDFIKRNDSTAYQRAKQLEKEGFNAITNNQFDIALVKFNQIIKFSPSFHSSYEIAMLLTKEKKNFENPETQQKIKEQIVKNYTWKAPAEQLKKIEVQVKQANMQPIKDNITSQTEQPVKNIDVKTPSVKVVDKTKTTYIIRH